MAIVVEVLVPLASRAESDRFDAGIDQAITERGGPPEGFMVHIGRPEGDGFLMIDVWRNEAEWRAFFDEVIMPNLAAAGLSAEDPRVSPAWTFARP